MQGMLSMAPAAFERLAQRILRESGFTQVEVTGRSGDGGIDGKGIFRIGLLSFHVNFQCKRWQGVVGPATIREFRGAITGRADKGLVITTGNFTKDAVREAVRDGALAIDLVDGQQLLDMLKDLRLGVITERVEVEDVHVDLDWFANV
jgi:restriction system protein